MTYKLHYNINKISYVSHQKFDFKNISECAQKHSYPWNQIQGDTWDWEGCYEVGLWWKCPKNLIFNRNYENVDNFQLNYQNYVGNTVNETIS